MKKTNRGFWETSFKDSSGDLVICRDSSLATQSRMWIFPQIIEHRGVTLCGAHLDRLACLRLIKILDTFLKHGSVNKKGYK